MNCMRENRKFSHIVAKGCDTQKVFRSIRGTPLTFLNLGEIFVFLLHKNSRTSARKSVFRLPCAVVFVLVYHEVVELSCLVKPIDPVMDV